MLSVGACDFKLDKVRASRQRCSAKLSCHWDGLNLQPDLAFTADFNKGGGTTPEREPWPCLEPVWHGRLASSAAEWTSSCPLQVATAGALAPAFFIIRELRAVLFFLCPGRAGPRLKRQFWSSGAKVVTLAPEQVSLLLLDAGLKACSTQSNRIHQIRNCSSLTFHAPALA